MFSGVTSSLKASGAASSVDEYDRLAQQHVQPDIRHYKVLGTLEQILDEQDLVVEETLMVESQAASPMDFSLRVVEMRSLDTVYATMREAEMLKLFGLHKNVMSLFSVFHHRQYVVFVFPDFTSMRDRLNVCYGLKHSTVASNRSKGVRESTLSHRDEDQSNQPGIFNRDSVVYVLRDVIKAVEFVHSRGYVHTQLGSSNVFMNSTSDVKLGGFLHCRKIESGKWRFTGNTNRHPPEAFVAASSNRVVGPSFDVWSMGRLTLELITGLGMSHSSSRMEEFARELLDGAIQPPTLGGIDPSTLRNGDQIYDADVDDFVACCMQVDPSKRLSIPALKQHPFFARSIDLDEAKRVWQLYGPKEFEWATEGSLYAEIMGAHCESSGLDTDFLLSLIKAVAMAERDCYPIIDKIPDEQLFNDYISFEALLAIQLNDEDWSREVLDVSRANSSGYLEEHRNGAKRRDKSTGSSLSGDDFRRPTTAKPNEVEKFQRSEMIFFVSKTWGLEPRRLFIGLQFARWYVRKLLSFSDLVRITSEIDDVVREYASPTMLLDTVPASASFVSGLRKSRLDGSAGNAEDKRKFNHVFVEVGLRREVVAEAKVKFDKLAEGDSVRLSPSKTTLQTAATYHELDIGRLRFLESLMLGDERVDDWSYHPEQRFDDALDAHTKLKYLLEERRKNPVRKFTNYNDPEASNQARIAKIWGNYDRDFLFRFCKFAVPYKMDDKSARMVFGNLRRSKSMEEQLTEFEQNLPLNELETQLLQTRTKQEEDHIYPFKQHDDVEARQQAIVRLSELGQNHEKRLSRLESMIKQMQKSGADIDVSSALSPAPPSKFRRQPAKDRPRK